MFSKEVIGYVNELSSGRKLPRGKTLRPSLPGNEMKLKIGIAHGTIQNGYGIERRILELSKRFARRGHDVSILARKFKTSPDDEVSVIQVGDPHKRMGKRQVASEAFSHLKKFDIVHTHYYPMIIAGSLANKTYGIPHIFTYHGITDPSFFSVSRKRKRRIRELKEIAKALYGVTKVITPSIFLKKDFLEKYGSKEISVTPNGVNDERFNPKVSGEGVRKKYGLGDAPTVLYLGRIAPHKSVPLLLDAMERVVKCIPNAKLLIAGKDKEGLLREMMNEGKRDYLIYAGFAPETWLPNFYAACDVYCSASLWEGFGMPFIEAMACGKPVVGFKTHSIPEVVKNGESGILVEEKDTVEMADALIELLEAGDKRMKMGIRAREHVERKYSWAKIAGQVLKEYYEVLER